MPYPFGHQTLLFSDVSVSVAERGVSQYRHTFGGPHDREGFTRANCHDLHLHLLHRFDLTDSAVPFKHHRCRWFPVYYCFDFRANTIGYRFDEDDGPVEFFLPADDPNVSDEESYPGEDYPMEFPYHRLSIRETEINAADPEDALMFNGVFGLSHLSESDYREVLRRWKRELDDDGFDVDGADDDFIIECAAGNPFVQGIPDTTCLNPRCTNQEEGSLQTLVFCSAHPIEGVETCGDSSDFVTLITQRCRDCGTIVVSNQAG